MRLSNFGAVRLPLLAAAVLALFACPVSAQIVERSQTWDNLIATHPCNAGLNGRHTILTDAQSSSSIGGGGGSVRVFVECDGVDTWSIVNIGSAGGGAATAVTGSATLPATCTEKDLYQDTDSGGTELYVCTATNTWTKAGDVVGPSSAVDNAIVRFDATTGKLVQGSTTTLSDAGALVLPVSGSFFLTVAGTDGGTGINSGGTISGIAAGGAISYQLLMTNDAWARLGSGKTINWNSATDMNSGSLDTTIARAAAGIVKITSALNLAPLASPPRTCDATAEGDIYSDTSHALCWCDASAWQKLSGAGTCA